MENVFGNGPSVSTSNSSATTTEDVVPAVTHGDTQDHNISTSASNSSTTSTEDKVPMETHGDRPYNISPEVWDDINAKIGDSGIRYAMVPKWTNIDFFEDVGRGFLNSTESEEDLSEGDGYVKCAGGFRQDITCAFIGPKEPNADEQAEYIWGLVEKNVSGIAVAILQNNHDETKDAMKAAMEKGIKVVTFDSDLEEDIVETNGGDYREGFVGTDNWLMGESLAKVLLQIDPMGGTYALITADAPNMRLREGGFRYFMNKRKSKWEELPDYDGNCKDDLAKSIELMHGFAKNRSVDAIIPLGIWPMLANEQPETKGSWVDFVDTYPNITTVSTDALQFQVKLINEDKVDGLVGQVPVDMGLRALQKLRELNEKNVTFPAAVCLPGEDFFCGGTKFLEVVMRPLNLDVAKVDLNLVDNLRYMGMLLWLITTVFGIVCAVWTFRKREHRVIRASQPFFLFMILGGILITATAILPLSLLEDNNSEEYKAEIDKIQAFKDAYEDGLLDDDSPRLRDLITCTSPIWFLSIGFTTVFSALFAKTWRINRLFHNRGGLTRLTVQAKDVLWPFFIMLSANLTALTLMTVFAPLEYKRDDGNGLDEWNRAIERFGQCKTTSKSWGGAKPYLAVLAVINLGVLIVAMIQAYQARSIQSEFSESHYIAVTMIFIFQTALIAAPVLALVTEEPKAHYVVLVCAVFIICAVTLGCIFIPKVFSAWEFDAQAKSKMNGSSARSNPVVNIAGAQVQVYNGGDRENVPSANTTSGHTIDLTDRTDAVVARRPFADEACNNSDVSEGEEDMSGGLRVYVSCVEDIEHSTAFVKK